MFITSTTFTALQLNAQGEGENSPRVNKNIDFGWKFKLSDNPDMQTLDFNDSSWCNLNLPHDWSIEGEYKQENPSGGKGGYLPVGIGCYRKMLDIPEKWLSKSVTIQFDGSYMNTDVWINGHHLGNRPYGYISFHYELAPYLKKGKNILAVRLDNSKAQSSRWYNGCGIYGHVNLIVTDKLRVAHWGTFVTTPKVTKKEAIVNIRTEIVNESKNNYSAKLVSEIISPEGEVLATTVKLKEMLKGSNTILLDSLKISNPKLWSPETPVLYTLRSNVYNGEAVTDTYITAFGIRSIEFNAQKGFILNGKSVKLKGVCEHHDGGSVGAAFPDKVLARRLCILKNMGCNAIRVAHNPRTPIFYKICDKLGIMVMDEIFDGWHKKAPHDYGAYYFNKWWKRDVTDWVMRDRNHPSVIMWSIGNETGLSDKHGITPFIHSLDQTRPTTGGTVFYGVDVSGFNAPGGIPGVLEKFHKKNPKQPVVLTEVPHTLQTRGFYRVPTWWRDRGNKNINQIPPYGDKQIFFDGYWRYSSSYDNCGVRISARTSWKRTKSTPWICGEFRWTGFDYIGEASFSGGKWPARIWNFGIIDLCGFPKDLYYFYQSQWTEKPMVHLLPHWTHNDLKAGTIVPVVAYSNCDEVELFLNGESQGIKRISDILDFVWKIPYKSGELKAIGYINSKKVAMSKYLTADDAEKIMLIADNNSLKSDNLDISHVIFKVVDKNGTMVPYSHDMIQFKWKGPIKHLGFENGDPIDVTAHRKHCRKTFYGMGLGIFQATSKKGDVELTAASIMGDKIFPNQTMVAIDAVNIALRGESRDSKYEFYYSLDGSKPTDKSNKYGKPFIIEESCTVKVLVLRDGKSFMTLTESFKKGEKKRVTDPRFQKASPKAQTFNGPFDKELVGDWQEGKIVFNFDAKGKFYRITNGKKNHIGWWWYDYPNDTFENPNNAGTGELRWKNSGEKSELQLTNQKAESLIIKTGKKRRKFLFCFCRVTH